jgi:hypothetical protein
MAIIHNKANTTFVAHLVANAALTIVGNNSVSNVALGTEVLTGCTIRKVFYGATADTVSWTIKRGANTVAVFNGTGMADFTGEGMGLNIDPTATLVANCSGTGYIMIECKKIGNMP